ncbi:hypothetical protein LCGC14_3150010 [marine sediment metagenome]|uniref:Uncharacterized protein n=1 Tax=marine sediment metagenome TaxID=412755 RepID=A0A0F8VUH4_9ZZZZ
MAKEPCFDCGCDDYDPYYIPVCPCWNPSILRGRVVLLEEALLKIRHQARETGKGFPGKKLTRLIQFIVQTVNGAFSTPKQTSRSR